MGLSGLGAALSGLRVAQQQIGLISNNVANASTEGYTRKILPQSSLTSQGITVGVNAENVIRNVDVTLERDLWTQVSSVSFYNVQRDYLEQIELFHGSSDSEISVSAKISDLRDAFSVLSDSPEDSLALSTLVSTAEDTANKINSLSDLVTTLRTDTQNEIEQTVEEINALLEQIAEVNRQIETANVGNRSVADLSDIRSNAVKDLSELIEISFFTRGDGTLVVQTNEGVELASETATQLFFDSNPVSATSYYPDSINGIFVGDPDEPFSVDITQDAPGGKLGGLIEMRDVVFPRYTAQVDELAHKLATRFDAQGLRLFTNAAGVIPGDTAPDTSVPTPVSYVGFGSEIQVNEAILANNALIQQGTATTDEPVQPGSNEVIRRVIEFAFGDYNYEQADGIIDMRSNATGGVDMQTWLGLSSTNTFTGGRDLESFATVADLVASANGALDAPTEEFEITFEEARTGLGPTTITINLTNANAQAGATALDQIVAEINAQITAAAVPAGLNASASVGPNGEIVINSTGTINIDGTSIGATGIGQDGLDFLGLLEGTYPPEDPYFDVQVGNDPIQRIYIEPGDTEAELIDKLILNAAGDTYNAVGDTTGIPGLAYDEVTFNATGELILRPGDDFNNPEFGGDLVLIAGPFEVDPAIATSPDIAALGAGNGVSIISALFGSFNVGPPAENLTPISAYGYESEVDASAATPTYLSFREDFLGPNADISTNLVGATNLITYSQRLVNTQIGDLIINESRISDEESLLNLLDLELQNESGVNIDEELANLIVYQTSYSASARVVSAIDELFQELLRAF